MDVVGRWWNGTLDRLARRDIWLTSDGEHWRVRARQGDSEGREVSYDFDREYRARAMVDRLKAAAPGEWKDLMKLLPRAQDRHGPT